MLVEEGLTGEEGGKSVKYSPYIVGSQKVISKLES